MDEKRCDELLEKMAADCSAMEMALRIAGADGECGFSGSTDNGGNASSEQPVPARKMTMTGRTRTD